MVRPGGHTTKGLSEKEVLETILTKKRELEKTLPITVNVVVYCDMYACLRAFFAMLLEVNSLTPRSTDRDACLFNQHAHFFVEAAKQHRDVMYAPFFRGRCTLRPDATPSEASVCLAPTCKPMSTSTSHAPFHI